LPAARLPWRRPAQEGLSKYIITDMYAKAVQGMPAEESVKWAEVELKRIYQAQDPLTHAARRACEPWQ
jgi:hypothetical protein